MGYEQVENVQVVSFRNLSAGWYPGKEHNDIPGSHTAPEQPLGAFDCDHVVWYEGALRKVFGYNNVNTTTLESAATINGMIDMTSQSNNLVGTVGTKLYSNLQDAVPADITGSLTLTAGLQCDLQEFRIGSTTMIIGVNGTDAPFKWEGAGNGAVLAGSPPTCRWIEYFNNYIFLARTATNPERLYFSGLSSPETWDTTNDFFTFDDSITGIKAFGNMLVVFKQDSIGILSGFGTQTWAKTDQFVKGVGCVGGQSVVSASIGGNDALVFLAKDGIYAFNGSPGATKLSGPIQRKFVSSSSAVRFNESRFSNAHASYWSKYNWYVISLTDGGGATNDIVMFLDLSRPAGGSLVSQVDVPHWPMDGVPANCLATRRSSGNEELFFGGTNGFVYKYDPGIFNQDGAAYTGSFQSKIFDLGQTYLVRESNLMGDEVGSTNVTLAINMDLQSGDGESDTVSLNETGDLLDSTFIMDTSALGGLDFVYGNADISNVGRFMQFKLSQATVNQQMPIEQVDIILKGVGLRPNVG